MSQFRPILTLSVVSAAAIVAERFVTKAGGTPAAAAKGFGVARAAADAAGQVVPVDVLGTAICSAGAAIADDADLELNASGQVITRSAGVKVGKALQAAAAVGDRIEILLTP